MKIVILAAGIGSRLGNPLPKPLTVLKSGKTIMQQQIDNLSDHFNPDDINIVVGFKKDLIMENFPDISYIYNQNFDTTNTSKSLLKALRKNRNESVLWLNGDVVFDSGILAHLKPFIQQEQSFVALITMRLATKRLSTTLMRMALLRISPKRLPTEKERPLELTLLPKRTLRSLLPV